MKRITAFILAIVMAFSLVGCSFQKPETVVEDYCKAIQAFDMEKLPPVCKTARKT